MDLDAAGDLGPLISAARAMDRQVQVNASPQGEGPDIADGAEPVELPLERLSAKGDFAGRGLLGQGRECGGETLDFPAGGLDGVGVDKQTRVLNPLVRWLVQGAGVGGQLPAAEGLAEPSVQRHVLGNQP